MNNSIFEFILTDGKFPAACNPNNQVTIIVSVNDVHITVTFIKSRVLEICGIAYLILIILTHRKQPFSFLTVMTDLLSGGGYAKYPYREDSLSYESYNPIPYRIV